MISKASLTLMVLVLGGMLLATPAQSQVGQNPGLLHPNPATAAELAEVPGLNSAAAEAIMEGRPFLRMADLHAVGAQHVGDDDEVERLARYVEAG